MKNAVFTASCWFCFAWSPLFAAVDSSPDAGGLSDQLLRETIERYFSGMSDFQQGDLICQSQVEEVQRYLRKTQGHIPATHLRLLHRALRDEAPLVRFFYMDDGAAILREAARRLGGYGPLQALSLTGQGRLLIDTAINSKDPELLVTFVRQESSSASSSPSSEQAERQRRPRDGHIYTMQQFIEASLSRGGAAASSVDGKTPAK